jgi:hypothetical protein
VLREWCLGPGVPNDEVSGPHEVAPEWQAIAWLRQTRGDPNTCHTKPRCRVCSQIRRDYFKNRNRLRQKAINTISSHAKRYAKKWGVSRQEARRRLVAYGWTVEAITALFEAAVIAGICPKDDACGWVWDHGEHEMTLDVKDPDALPLLSNLWVICRTCNTRKNTMRLTEWREFRAYWDWVTRRAPSQLNFGF